MKTWDIIVRLKILTFLPIGVFGIIFAYVTFNAYQNYDSLRTLKRNVNVIVKIARLSNELQRERGITAGYLNGRDGIFHTQMMQQRQQVDAALASFLDSERSKVFYRQEHTLIQKLRQEVDSRHLSATEAFDRYTQGIMPLFRYHMSKFVIIADLPTQKILYTYSELAMMKESLGEMRGAMNGIFTLHSIDRKLLYRALRAKGVHDASWIWLKVSAPKDILERIRPIIHSSQYQWLQQTIDHYATTSQKTSDIDPRVWWRKATAQINRLYAVEEKLFVYLTEHVQQRTQRLMWMAVFLWFLYLGFAIGVALLAFWIRNKILTNVRLLQEYKDAVDRSSIISKTTKRGVITYANDKFCDISGYSREELLGKPHNILRHPDMPREAFADMWQTILAGKPWTGIIKNRKKDGGSYTVEATISPILNPKGEIEEFIAIRNDISEIIRLNEEITSTQSDLILRLSEVIDTRDHETGFHIRRVAEYTRILATHYGLDAAEIEELFSASVTHDIGKIGIPDAILNKPGRYTDEEMAIMQKHTQIGYQIFKDSNKALLKAAAIIAYEHHEKYDGTGYPRGLSGDAIHIYGRITALADVFDALSTRRPYKEPWSDEDVFAYIKAQSGRHFDPKLVTIFFENLDEFLAIRAQYREDEV